MAPGEVFITVLLLFLVSPLRVVETKVTLRHLSTEYLPVSSDGETEVFEYNVKAARQLAFDPAQPYIYVAGIGLIHVLDYSDPENIQRVTQYSFPVPGAIVDLETCGDLLAVSFDDENLPLSGKVFIFRTYDGSSLQLLQAIIVGAVPDQVQFTSDCDLLVVAIEGEPRMWNEEVVDPEGEIAVIRFLNSDADYALSKLDFKDFNDVAHEYMERGVRWVWRGECSGKSNTFSQDLEPESVAISADDSTAYIVLQENNGLAVLDLTTLEIVDIYPLGAKHWLSETMDASDRDDGIELRNWDIYGLHQPDGIQYVSISGSNYLLLANEGHAKEFDPEDYGFEWEEASRAKHFDSGGYIDDSVSSEMRDFMSDDADLGRLFMSTIDGIVLTTGKIDTFYSYGSRSFSLVDASAITEVYNSKDMLETEIAAEYPDVFNSNYNSDDQTPEDAMDTRSDNEGPEPETIQYAEIELGGQTRQLIFLAMSRPGFLGVFSVSDGFPSSDSVALESLHYNGGYGDTFEDLWNDRVARDLNPDDLKVLPASSSPSGEPLLAVAASGSGTVTLYAIYDDTLEADDTVSLPKDYISAGNNRPQQNKQDTGKQESGRLPLGAIVAVAVGCVCVLVVVITGSLYIASTRKKRSRDPPPRDTDSATGIVAAMYI